MSLPPYAADLVVPIAWGVVGLLLAALVYALLRGRRTAAAGTSAADETGAGPVTDSSSATVTATAAHGPTPADRPAEAAEALPRPDDLPGVGSGGSGPTAPVDLASPLPGASPAPAGAWDQGQPAPEPAEIPVPTTPVPTATVPTADVREMRVLRRQVDVLTRTLAEWDQVRAAAEPAPTTPAPAPAAPEAVAGPAPGPVPRPSLPGAAYLDLSRRLAERGDLEGAVLAQWACDLEVLRGPLAGHEGDLATAVAAVSGDDPVVVLRGCREAALALVAVAGPVRTLLAPLDHLAAAAGAAPADRVRTAGFPAELVDLAPEADRPALSALVAGQQA